MLDLGVNIAIGLSMVVVLITFILGMVAFGQNGAAASARLNRLMAWRVRTQLIAIVVLAVGMLIKAQA
ncbi:putative membrane protein [Asticcacaulis biprosthecium C19]|uniref:Putative membrane protein n=1 Tax=Asticcacaulis biprosthecium C19 TaxID=715226 RepID=F4QHL0_9CAUL|nr:hypothetical protein [Asticcacaulis biprosthecium]EGF92747.1 putative membrane protein [Asticcacaulis biprosthecium C19]